MSKTNAKKSIDLKRKIKAYSAITGGLVALTPMANAQIVYTDIEPDTSITEIDSTYLLDLNNDGIKDFGIMQLFKEETSPVASLEELALFDSIGDNKVLVDYLPFGTSVGNFALALNQGDTIDNDQVIWKTYCVLQAAGTYNSAPANIGHWGGVSDKYLGFKFDISSTWHYGWARLSVNTEATVATIKDYAYNTVADEMILAGQTVVGINNIPAGNEFDVYSFNKKMVVDCGNRDMKNATLSIFNTAGQQVKQLQINSRRTEIEMNDTPAGIYFVRLMNENGTFSRKININ